MGKSLQEQAKPAEQGEADEVRQLLFPADQETASRSQPGGSRVGSLVAGEPPVFARDGLQIRPTLLALLSVS